MKIALYASQLAPGGPTGIHRYVSELIRALFALHPERYQLLASAEEADPTWLPDNVPVRRLPGPRRALHLAWLLARRPPIDRFADGADLVHVLYPTFPVPSRVPFVCTFHDIQHIVDPGSYGRREGWLGAAAVRDAAARAARIVAVSAAVGRAASERLAIDPARIVVVHHGIADRFRTPPPADIVAKACSRVGVEPGHYFLYVGKVEARKNVETLVRALARRGSGARLLVAGPPGLGAELLTTEIERLGLAEDVIIAGYIDADLPALMTGAIALVHASEYESFGLPPLEAMALGTPAVTSNTGALPEVLGDAALLLEAHDVDAWAEAMTRLEHDREYAAALGEAGRLHAQRFTWERAAKETAAVHESVLST